MLDFIFISDIMYIVSKSHITNDIIEKEVMSMAKKIEKFVIKGVEVTENVKRHYDYLLQNGKVDYKQTAQALNETEAKAKATLAYLEGKGLAKKNVPIKVTTYEIL